MSEPATQNAADQAELHTQLFANLVMQQASMTLMFLGVTPHPQTGETMFDLDGAQHFIAQLEMLEAKTRGNLGPDETAILKQSLAAARMAFVQAVERGAPPATAKEAVPTPPVEVPPEPAAHTEAAPATDDERKKFVKKY